MTPDQRASAQESYRPTKKARQTAHGTLAEIVPADQVTDSTVERYLLWQEQGGHCVYTGQPIEMLQLLNGAIVQIDHIQPVSRGSDYSKNNTVVCFAKANQEKGDLTPFEWRGSDAVWWAEFKGRLAWMHLAPRKRRLLLSQEFSQREGSALNRNLNDTSYVARCVLAGLRVLYPGAEGYQRVAARPGQLTAVLRRVWGLSKDRAEAKSHAQDALVVAAASDRILFGMATARRKGQSTIDMILPLPWPGFVEAARQSLLSVKISKSEQKRGRGAGHAHTVRRIREDVGGERVLHERRPIHRLRLADLARVPDPEVNAPLVRALSAWIEAGSPIDTPPLSPQGDPIRHVRLKLVGKTGVSRDGLPIRGGLASYTDLVRVDVFCRDGKYTAVPIHAVDVATFDMPPTLVPVGRKLRKDWWALTPDYSFLFSIHRNSLIRAVNREGKGLEGFFRRFEQRSVRFALAEVERPGTIVRVPVSTALRIEKFHLDRLGNRFPVK